MSAQIVHGGGLDKAMARYGGERAEWLDLSTGINPVSWPVPEISADAFQRLPDTAAHRALVSAARQAYGVAEDTGLVAANGTQALIEMLPHVLPCDRVAIVGPTYQEHALCWTKAGRHVEAIGSTKELPALSNALVVVNPNNPDGRVWGRGEMVRLAEIMALRHGWLIIDEAFADCDPQLSSVPLLGGPDMPENIIVLRSFGKFFGLAGVRLGFAVAPQAICVQLEHLFGPWAVSGPALEVGAKALSDVTWVEQTRLMLFQRSQRLRAVLQNAGLEIVGGTPLFTLTEAGNAAALHESLCRQRIMTRRFPAQPGWLRFGVCPDDENLQRLAMALHEAKRAIA